MQKPSIQNKSYHSNATSHDNTFNFGNQLDISNGKKQKTGQLFFNFQDFQNIGDDKTVKSSNYKARHNQSNILKRQNDQFSNQIIGNSILDNQQDTLSNQGWNPKSIIESNKKKVYYDKQPVSVTTFPKFGDRKLSAQSNVNERGPEGMGDGSPFQTKQGFGSNPDIIRRPNQNNFYSSDLSYTKSNIQGQHSVIGDTAGNNSLNANPFKNQGILQMDSKIVARNPQNQHVSYNFAKKAKVHQQLSPQQQMLQKQLQYKQIISMINYYKNESEKMAYQKMVLQQQSIKQLMIMTQSQTYQEQIKNNLYSINQLNGEIQKQRAIEKKLTRVISQLQEEYNQIIESINQMDFKRPPVIKDQAKVLIDEINQLKNQFDALQRDNGALNLSCTIFANSPNSIQNRQKQSRSLYFNHKQTSQHPQSQQTQRFVQSLIEQIHEQNSISQDPSFLKNLKVACLKQQWTIFSNKQIIISIDYKLCPVIRLRIGNKVNQLLSKFTISIQGKNISTKLMENQVVNKKSFLVQGIRMEMDNLSEIFLKLTVSYQIEDQNFIAGHQKQKKSVKFFLPTGILNFGEFNPLTFKQFQTQLNLPLPIIQSAFKPIDKNLISSLQQIMMYFPNLRKWQNDDNKIFGLFMSVFNEGTLLIVQNQLDLLKIKLKNGSKPLLKLLEFILTV